MRDGKEPVDLLYRQNKYVKSDGKIKISKAFLLKLWISKLTSAIFFVCVILGFGLLFYYTINFGVLVEGKEYKLLENKEYNISQKVGFNIAEEASILHNILFVTKLKEVSLGEIITLPQGIAKINGETVILKSKEYAIKCLGGECKKDRIYLILEKQIYGIINEVK